MLTFRRLAMAGAAILATGSGHATDRNPQFWSNNSSPYDTSEDVRNRAHCRELGPPIFPAADRPAAGESVKLKNCDSEALYYGIGEAVDYVAARKCAIIEFEQGDFFQDSIGGPPLLMQIYGNGLGVPRNRDLALRIACTFDGTSVRYLQSLPANQSVNWFESGDGSGLKQGIYAQHQARINDITREKRLARAVNRLGPAVAKIFPAVHQAADAFSEESGNDEVDARGTARVADWTLAREKQDDQFIAEVERLASGDWPIATAQQARSADLALNREYRRALAWAASSDNYTTVKTEDIRKAQRVWLTYRDAWVRLAPTAHISGDSINARITRLRTDQLENLR